MCQWLNLLLICFLSLFSPTRLWQCFSLRWVLSRWMRPFNGRPSAQETSGRSRWVCFSTCFSRSEGKLSPQGQASGVVPLQILLILSSVLEAWFSLHPGHRMHRMTPNLHWYLMNIYHQLCTCYFSIYLGNMRFLVAFSTYIPLSVSHWITKALVPNLEVGDSSGGPKINLRGHKILTEMRKKTYISVTRNVYFSLTFIHHFSF